MHIIKFEVAFIFISIAPVKYIFFVLNLFSFSDLNDNIKSEVVLLI